MGTPNSATIDANELRELANGQPPSRELREFKFVVQAVLLIVENGQVVGEQPADPEAIYGINNLRGYAETFPGELAKLNGQLNGTQTQG